MTNGALSDLNDRSRDIFRRIVEAYLETGEPVGSRTLSQLLPTTLSPASIRNTMSDLERMGLLYAPHASAGRLPTDAGLRLFVDGLMEVGDLTAPERAAIEERLAGTSRKPEDVLTEATALIAGLTQGAGVVLAPTANRALKHIQFVALAPGRALVITVDEDGAVENRVIDTPLGLPSSALVEATNYLTSRLAGRTLEEAREAVLTDVKARRAELDALTAKIVEAGLATWTGAQTGQSGEPGALIVRGTAHLLEDVTAAQDLERVRLLFDDLERKKDVAQLLELAKDANGVKIFIGSENKLFSLSGSSLIAAPYTGGRQSRIVGVLGVIGPTRLNYARVIPMVDYTAKVVSRLLG